MLTDFSETNGKIIFETNYEHESTIVLPVNYYPNWVAEINGKKVELEKNNDNLIVLRVPRGKNTVLLEFREMLYEKILYLTSAAAAIYFFLLLLQKIHKEQKLSF